MAIGFNNDYYTELQFNAIMERITDNNNKLYLEFGGKLFDDYHASRVLPGFDPNIKTKLLLKFKEKAEIIFSINANDLEKNKMRADFGINYGLDVLRVIDNLRALGIYVNSVVITQYNNQPAADIYKKKLEMLGEKVYIHKKTLGYPTDVEKIVSDDGYGKNTYIETSRPLVVVTAPGPGSGKLATCLSQLYHEYKRGVMAGYAKFETFPIWNLPLKHPVNKAYEAATADLKDVNMIDFFHLESYKVPTVNYNRDIEVFPIVKNILEKIQGDCKYKSPTDMGVYMAGYAITDYEVVQYASKQEILRRFYHTIVENKLGLISDDAVSKLELLMSEMKLTHKDRACVDAALKKAEISQKPAFAIELNDIGINNDTDNLNHINESNNNLNGVIITGRTTATMSAAAGCVINAIKHICNINDSINLISQGILTPITELKQKVLKENNHCLNLQEVLVALSISAPTNPMAELAIKNLYKLHYTEAHSSCILSESDASMLRKLRINVTMEPVLEANYLFV